MWLIKCTFVVKKNFDVIKMHGATIKIRRAEWFKDCLSGTFKAETLCLSLSSRFRASHFHFWFCMLCQALLSLCSWIRNMSSILHVAGRKEKHLESTARISNLLGEVRTGRSFQNVRTCNHFPPCGLNLIGYLQHGL
jgi:hypothetical protein